MRLSLQDRVLRREIGQNSPYASFSSIYGDREFVEGLDIVNELEGHSGCVNALSWSRSGRLLASGSDDRVVNIYSYQPDQTRSQFALATSIETSHSANIFSVKFMPNSNDSTIITCAGDDEVRVFDIERSSQSTGSRSYLSTSSANGKVFRSHSSAVKRIVTEASPYYFLTCSEDGEVRQWDIRQPESAYPRKTPAFRRVGASQSLSDGPPALISYARYSVELWTISCSPSQPHYIALGGTHLHCFLHDRRMLGRNKLIERGGNIPRSLGDEASTEALYDATRCVAKFAPHGQPTMTKNDSGKNISACKLGTADPNELIVSWMGDYIYSFNILKDIKDSPPKKFSIEPESVGAESKHWTSRKRKRIPAENGSPSDGPNFRTRTEEHENTTGFEVIVRVGGMPVTIRPRSSGRTETAANPHAQKIRSLKNALAKTHFAHDGDERYGEMLEILLSSSTAFEMIDQHIAERTYPVTESGVLVAWELNLTNNRAKVWRYVQASGTLARVLLGYRTQPVMHVRARNVDLESFDIIKPSPREGRQPLDRHEHFGYDFIKAVLLWLESGVGAVLREFSMASRYAARATRRRLPVPKDAGIDALETHLLPYLTGLAADIPIVYAGHGGAGDDPRETDEVFPSEKAAVRALVEAMKIQFEDLHETKRAVQSEYAETPEPSASTIRSIRRDRGIALDERGVLQNRNAAITFWGHRVCMAVLNSASIDVNFPFVATAFDDHQEESSRRTSAEEPVDHDEGDSDDNSSDDSDNSSDEDFSDKEDSYSTTRKNKFNAAKSVPASSHVRTFQGHCNVDTTKDVNFYGRNDEYVVSGSDCGNVFIWDKKTGGLVNILRGDGDVVNVIQPHPYEPILAVSGIDETVKIFSPDSRARREARHSLGVIRANPAIFSSSHSRRRRRRRGERNTHDRDTQTGDKNDDDADDLDGELDRASDSDSEHVYSNGLESRQMMSDSYAITSENDMNRRSGNNQRYISRGLMEQLAFQLGGGGVEQLEDADENCILM